MSEGLKVFTCSGLCCLCVPFHFLTLVSPAQMSFLKDSYLQLNVCHLLGLSQTSQTQCVQLLTALSASSSLLWLRFSFCPRQQPGGIPDLSLSTIYETILKSGSTWVGTVASGLDHRHPSAQSFSSCSFATCLNAAAPVTHTSDLSPPFFPAPQ